MLPIVPFLLQSLRPVLPGAGTTVAIFALSAAAALAQGTAVEFGNGRDTSDQPVEVTADELQMNRDAGTATFRGNVLIVQGPMRLSGNEVDVFYGPGPDGETRVERVEARGGVVLVNGTDAAEGETAIYTIESGDVLMTGDVLLTRPDAAMTGERLRVNVDDGTGVMEGRVTVVFTPESDASGGTGAGGGDGG